MTTYNIVRVRVKKERQAEFEDTWRRQKRNDAPMKGLRHEAVIRPSPGNYCLIGEWESYDDMADARSALMASLAELRPLLEDLGGGLGVTYAVSGDAIIEFAAGAGNAPPADAQPAIPHAYNVVRQRVKVDRVKDYESGFRAAIGEFSIEAPAGLHKVAVVSLGARSYCVVGRWESFDHLAAARPLLIKRLDESRDLLEDLGGGLGVTYAVAGEAIYEYS